MRNSSGWLVALALAAVATAVTAQTAVAQERRYPTRPIELVIPYAPGGGSGITGEVMKKIMPTADTIAKSQLGQPIWRKPAQAIRRSRARITAAMPRAPKMPRQPSIVQLSNGISLVNRPAVLQATAEAVISIRPSPYPDGLMEICFPIFSSSHRLCSTSGLDSCCHRGPWSGWPKYFGP